MLGKRFFVLILAFLPVLNYAQNSVQDSLTNLLNNEVNPSEKAKILVSLARNSQDREEALKYSLEATSLAETNLSKSQAYNQAAWSYKNLFKFDSAKLFVLRAEEFALATKDALTISDVYNTFGSIYNNQSKYDSALIFYRMSLDKRVEAQDLSAQAASMNNLSIVLQRQGKFADAANYIDQSIAIYEELALPRRAADSYLNKGNLLVNAGDLDSAYVNFQSALKMYESLSLDVMMTYALINMGTVAIELNNFEHAHENLIRSLDILNDSGQNAQLMAFTLNGLGTVYEEEFSDMDSAIYYYSEGAKYAVEASSDYLLSISHNNLGRLNAFKGNDSDALTYYESALKLKQSMGDGSGLSLVHVGLGELYAKLNQHSKARSNFRLGLEKAIEVGDISDLETVYRSLSNYEKSRGNYRKALEYSEEAQIKKDSLLNAKHLKNVEDLNVQYETEKKEQQIALQESQLGVQEARLQRNQLFLIVLILVAFLLITLVVLVRNREKRKQELIRRESELKVREAEINAVINSQEKERNRFAQDLHDGFGQLISVLKMNLANLNSNGKTATEDRVEVFEKSEAVINDMYSELRNICFDLMPQTLVKNGLVAALKEFGIRVTETGQKTLEVLVFDADERLPELIEVSLYRICQEWVNNILKYSDAQLITLQLTRDQNELTLSIEDDGKGFNTAAFYSGKGNGWRNISSRLNLINGVFELDSREGINGTFMSVNLALNSEEAIPTATEDQITS